MKDYHIFSTNTDSIDTALLIKRAAYTRSSIKTYYVRDAELEPRVIALPLEYEPGNKLSAKFMASQLEILLPELNALGVKTLYVADSKYFQHLTKQNVTDSLGSITYCKLKGYEHMQVIAGVNYQSIFHNPNNKDLLDISINSLVQHISGYDISKPKDIIKKAKYLYCDGYETKEQTLETELELLNLINEPILSIDIEAKPKPEFAHIEKSALRFNMNILTSIAFSISESEGSALYFNGHQYAKQKLKDFFIRRAKICQSNLAYRNVYHNGLFDIKQLVYHLFMDNPGDIDGMLYGINIMCQNIDDTMVMKYVTTNNVQDNSLGLKDSILAYTGQYAVDVKDITNLPIEVLLEYNLKDVLGTRWLYNKLIVDMENENQTEVYKDVLMPTFPVLLEMMLVGLPLDMKKVAEAKEILTKEFIKSETTIHNLPIIKEYTQYLQQKATDAKNASLKKKQVTIEDFRDIQFNPGSPQQRSELLYQGLSLPILDYTKTKQPASGNKTIVKLLAHAKEHGLSADIISLLEELTNYTDVSKILNTFISAFELYAFERGDGTVWLNGDQILCGTVSGRLGSRNPNLANLPSNSRFGKLVKSCFQAPPGYTKVNVNHWNGIIAVLKEKGK